MATNTAFNSLKERLDANAMQYDGGATLDDLNDKKKTLKSKVITLSEKFEVVRTLDTIKIERFGDDKRVISQFSILLNELKAQMDEIKNDMISITCENV